MAQEKKSVWPKDCPVLIDGGGSMDGLRRNMAEAMKLDPRASWVEINTERDAGCPTLNKKK
ncbi:MAG: hypothetical protein NT019_01950 [Candidatus Adlerbacteria bacterium]|nr:hypothetical protein [Candidatus Adlerbacteria bacterium]